MSYFSPLLNEGQQTVCTISKLSFVFHTTAYLGCIFMSLDLCIFHSLFCVKKRRQREEKRKENQPREKKRGKSV